MAITKVSGINGLIYVSGHEIIGANAFEIAINKAAVEGAHFGQAWQDREAGIKDWSGSITAWFDQDSDYLYHAATSTETVPVVLYPKRSVLTDYWSGNAVFTGWRTSVDIGSLISHSVDFQGSGSPTATGFA